MYNTNVVLTLSMFACIRYEIIQFHLRVHANICAITEETERKNSLKAALNQQRNKTQSHELHLSFLTQ